MLKSKQYSKCNTKGCCESIHRIVIVDGMILNFCKICFKKLIIIGCDSVVIDFSKTKNTDDLINQIK